MPSDASMRSFSRYEPAIVPSSPGRDKTTQTFKSLNTVIAFCSSRKHLAITFSVIRSSVENIIKRSVHLLCLEFPS